MESSQSDLSVTVNGLHMPNPFVTGSGISFQEQRWINRAFDEGWGAVIAKTPYSVVISHGWGLALSLCLNGIIGCFEPFHVPEDVKKHWSRHTPEGAALEAEWNAKYAEYEKKYPEDAAELNSITDGVLPAGWEKALPTYTPETPADATRNLSQTNLNALATVIPGLIGGSADLASSNMTLMKMFGKSFMLCLLIRFRIGMVREMVGIPELSEHCRGVEIMPQWRTLNLSRLLSVLSSIAAAVVLMSCGTRIL